MMLSISEVSVIDYVEQNLPRKDFVFQLKQNRVNQIVYSAKC